MNRRGFFSKFAGVAAVAGISAKVEATPDVSHYRQQSEYFTKEIDKILAANDAKRLENNRLHHGYDIRWNGWKDAYNDESLVGCWLATPICWQWSNRHDFPQKPFIYSCTGGVVDWYGLGYVFNLTHQRENYVTSRTPADHAERVKEKAYLALCKFINEHGGIDAYLL